MPTKTVLPVIAAIPNYNMADSLRELLQQLIAQNYAAIYVLDDLSTDDSKTVVKLFGSKVTWVAATENLGSGGARNRILAAHKINCIIHFLDADVRLLSTDVVANAHRMMTAPDTGFVGGLVIERGKQSRWNYGQRPTLRENVRGLLQPFRRPSRERKEIFWTHEANMLIERDVLETLGGFDATIREHDGMTLAYYAQEQGRKLYFDPAIVVEHKLIKIRGYNRVWRRMQTARYLRRKLGLKLWV